MGFISDISTEEKVSIVFKSLDVSVTKGVAGPKTYSTVATKSGLFWTSSAAISFLSDKLNTQVDGFIAIDYNATIAALDDNSIFTVGTDIYEVLHIDNPGKQNEILQIAYKRGSSK